MDKKGKVCEIIDILTLEMLDLMEERVRCIVDIETRMNNGNLLLAKARYIGGSQTISSSKLPTENSQEFKALNKVMTEEDDELKERRMTLQKFSVDKGEGYLDPLKWFGVLVPQCLQQCKERFQNTLELVIEYANIQNKLNSVMHNLYKLKYVNK